MHQQKPTDTLVTAQLLEDQGASAWKQAKYVDTQDGYEQALAIVTRTNQ
jgi:hypothetical protein